MKTKKNLTSEILKELYRLKKRMEKSRSYVEGIDDRAYEGYSDEIEEIEDHIQYFKTKLEADLKKSKE